MTGRERGETEVHAQTAVALDRDQRDAVRAHLVDSLTYGTVDDFPFCLQLGDWDAARELRDTFEDGAVLLDALGWSPDDTRDRFVLALAPDRLGRVVDRLRQQAAMTLATSVIGTCDDEESIELAKNSLRIYGQIAGRLAELQGSGK